MNMETVRVYNEERAKAWKKILGTDTVPIVSLISQLYDLPIGEKYCYLLDLKKLSKEQKENLIKHLAKKFNIKEEIVRNDIDKQGVPILVDDCIASSTKLFKYIDDYDFENANDYCDGIDDYGGM